MNQFVTLPTVNYTSAVHTDVTGHRETRMAFVPGDTVSLNVSNIICIQPNRYDKTHATVECSGGAESFEFYIPVSRAEVIGMIREQLEDA
jgi:hypothetical protein